MKAAIVGLSGDGANVPWDDPEWQVWGLNGGHMRGGLFLRPDGRFRADRWFQMHPPNCCDPGELDWLQRLDDGDVPPVPTYVRAVDMAHWTATYPKAAEAGLFLPYPEKDIAEQFPGCWFANTFCLEIALALSQGATEIGLFGTECAGWGREVAVERPAVAFWMGLICGAGVGLVNGNETLFYGLENPRYGLDYWPEARKAAELTERVLPPVAPFNDENLDTVAAVDAAEDLASTREAQHAV